jgi:hypothetical protein
VLAKPTLHEQGVDPAAVLEPDLCEQTNASEAASSVQSLGGRVAGVGDNGDHLMQVGACACRQQFGEQPAAYGPA